MRKREVEAGSRHAIFPNVESGKVGTEENQDGQPRRVCFSRFPAFHMRTREAYQNIRSKERGPTSMNTRHSAKGRGRLRRWRPAWSNTPMAEPSASEAK